MNRLDVIKLLTEIAAYDYRRVNFGDMEIEAWFRALDDLTYGDASAAVVSFYRESKDSIMPADVRHIVRDKVAAEKHAQRERPPALALTSRFEPDEVRGLQLARGQAVMAEVMGPILAKLAEGRRDREQHAAQTWDELRQITAGPNWPDPDAPAAIEDGAV